MYKIDFTNDAKLDLSRLAKNEPAAYKKAMKLIDEVSEHPKTGTGHPKPLSANRQGQWSRNITDKHRLIYEIKELELLIITISAYGHYGDK